MQFLEKYKATQNVCLDSNELNGKSLLLKYIEDVFAKKELVSWTIAIIGSSSGSDTVRGMDEKFKVVNRRRLMQESNPDKPLYKGRVTFKAVAMGSHEKIDLSEEKRAEVDNIIKNNPKLSRATCYRAAREKTKGLLLIYPIMPTISDKIVSNENTQTPVIAIAVSLPDSDNDPGQTYRCSPQKIREMFGYEFCDDLSRDDEEEENNNLN